jgi:hypothetical protein
MGLTRSYGASSIAERLSLHTRRMRVLDFWKGLGLRDPIALHVVMACFAGEF